MHLPRPPALDGERWFKVVLVTLLRGKIEAEGGDAAGFEEAARRWVPYHPAGRLPERKVSNPAAAGIERAVEHEQALLAALTRLPDAAARLAWLYEDDPVGLEARLVDPEDLGPAYGFAALGPDATWDALAAWGAGDPRFREAARRAVPARWALFEGRPERAAGPRALEALAAELPDALRVPWGAEGVQQRLVAELEPDPAARLILVGEEAAVAEILTLLLEHAPLRDRVLAVVSLGGVIGGREDEDGRYGRSARQDWLEANFRQRALDVDAVRLIPYAAVQWLDPAAWPPGVVGLPLQASRFPEPSAEGASVISVEVVDLGPLWAGRDLPPALIARALVATICGWVASRR